MYGTVTGKVVTTAAGNGALSLADGIFSQSKDGEMLFVHYTHSGAMFFTPLSPFVCGATTPRVRL
jgi:hypothetical protein